MARKNRSLSFSAIYAAKLPPIKLNSKGSLRNWKRKKNNAIRKAGPWIAEKFSRAKIRASELRDGELGLYLALESRVLGITSKYALWRGLEVATGVVPKLRGLDYAQLQERAREQRDRVEAKRLELARGGLQTPKAIARAEGGAWTITLFFSSS